MTRHDTYTRETPVKRTLIVMALSAVLMLAAASPAFAATGDEFGTHHSTHAIEMDGFTTDMNPGVHKGFAGWTGA